MRYLSLDWIDSMADAVSGSTELQSLAAGITLGITQVVTDTPEGNVTYHLQLVDGRASFGAGAAPHEDVRMEQSWDTALKVARHELPAQEVFVKGLVKVGGDIQKLIPADPVFAALDVAFETVRQQTTY
jgi:hypothetical protein